MVIFKRDTTRDVKWLDKLEDIYDEDYLRIYTIFGFIKVVHKFKVRNDINNTKELKIKGFKNEK